MHPRQTDRIKIKKLPIIADIAINIIFLALLFLGIRGSVDTFPLRENTYRFSHIASITNITANPIIAFFWAKSNYKKLHIYKEVVLEDGEKLYGELLENRIYIENKKDSFLEQNPPHVVVNLMESFGLNLLEHDDKSSLDLLGSLRENFSDKRDHFVFRRFVSSTNGTASTFADMFLVSPQANITFDKPKERLPYSAFDVYKKAGYRVVFITSGNGAWHNLFEALPNYGVDEFVDVVKLTEEYPEIKDMRNSYGADRKSVV